MKNVILLLLFISFISIESFSQSSNLTKSELRQMERIKRKEIAEKQAVVDAEITKKIIEKKRYVLLADELSNRYGERSYVDRAINFILVDTTEAVIQVGDYYSLGANGLGGITIKGDIQRFWQIFPSRRLIAGS